LDPDFAAIVGYPCPRCGVGLEARSLAIPEWLRCPSCGKGGRPPLANTKRTPMNYAKFAYDPDVLVIGEEPTAMEMEMETPWYGTTQSRPFAPERRPAFGNLPASAKRTGLSVVFSLCLSMFFVTLFLGESFKAGLFGVAAGVILLFLVRPTRPSARP
jgi:hypothetical protein